MKNWYFFPLFFLMISLFSFRCSKHIVPPVSPVTPPVNIPAPSTDTTYHLVWSDEFNYTGLPDSSKWSYEVGNSGWGNNELEYYTAQRAQNARVEGGNLIIEADKESYGGSNYTSARLVTKGKAEWEYGKIEVRAKIPRGIGTWPAIWMLGSETPLVWPDDGEIDIMEEVGFDPGMIHGTVHTKSFNWVLGTQKTDSIAVKDAADSFHVYSLTWTPASIALAVDSTTYLTFFNTHQGFAQWPFDHSCFLILNLAIGGNWGGQAGVDNTIFPQQMLVDYVRVYQK
ncbi:MAG: glycoside hydrolase family 16 protein [Chitinophagaceae bacterium]